MHPCSRRDREGSSPRPCVSMRGSSRDDAKYVQTTYTDGASGDDGCEGNGKPVYVSTRIDDEEGVAPYLYSPARRNSWLVGTDPCRANGWIEVRAAPFYARTSARFGAFRPTFCALRHVLTRPLF